MDKTRGAGMISNMQPKIWIWLKRQLSGLFFMLYLRVLGQTEEQYWDTIREYMGVKKEREE